jgi:hypothetical protein
MIHLVFTKASQSTRVLLGDDEDLGQPIFRAVQAGFTVRSCEPFQNNERPSDEMTRVTKILEAFF